MQAPRGGGGSDGSARGCDTSGCPSLQSCPQPFIPVVMGSESSTSAYGHRSRTAQPSWRRWSTSRTQLHGDRTLHLRGRGGHLYLRLRGRRRQSRLASWLPSSFARRCFGGGARRARRRRYGPEGLLQVRRHPFRAAEADPHGPVCSADHRVSPVAVRFRWSMPLLCWSCLPCRARVDYGILRPWLVMLVAMRLGCVPLGCCRPRSSASWPVWTRRTVAVACSRLVLLVTMHLALCSLPLVGRPRILGIMTVLDQKNSCPISFTFLSWCGGRSPWSSDHGDSTVAVRQGFFVPVVLFVQLHRCR